MPYDVSRLKADLTLFKSVADAETVVGGLSKPSKMPWLGWSISAKRCKVGGKLAQVKGSVCEHCYALKSRYVFNNVQAALERRHASSLSPLFVPAFIFLLNEKAKKVTAKQRFFRWFDSGDLQSLDMLLDINTIATQTPAVSHWLPTKETAIVREFYKNPGLKAPNLTIRVSAPMIDQAPTWPVGSAVFTNSLPDGAKQCLAPSQGNTCGSCRTCWDNTVPLVAYHAH